jgi:prepilin-type N-terminal cleavage/methylation domain-containing protein
MLSGFVTSKVSRSQCGFSVVEMLVVIAMSTILLAVAVFAFTPSKKLYKAEDAAAQVVNFMRDAYQRAITQRQAMMLIIDRNNSRIQIVDQGRFPSGDEAMVRRDALMDLSEVRIERPSVAGVAVGPPPSPYNYSAAGFNQDNVWSAVFLSDGSVVDSSATPAPLSVTLYFWPTNPSSTTEPKDPREICAVTMFGPSGSIRYWRYNGSSFVKEVN